MRISYPICVVVVAAAMLQVSGGQAAAQVEATATGSLMTLSGGGAWEAVFRPQLYVRGYTTDACSYGSNDTQASLLVCLVSG